MYNKTKILQDNIIALSMASKSFVIKDVKDNDIYMYCDFMKQNFLQLSGNN